jgi:hypothetical protein
MTKKWGRKRGGNVKLTVEIVIAIKDGLHDGVQATTLAATFGVSQATVSLIKHGKHWSEVKATHEEADLSVMREVQFYDDAADLLSQMSFQRRDCQAQHAAVWLRTFAEYIARCVASDDHVVKDLVDHIPTMKACAND